MIDLSLLSVAQLREICHDNGLVYQNKSKSVLVAELHTVLLQLPAAALIEIQKLVDNGIAGILPKFVTICL